jgi:hypothetical protein
MDVLSIIHASSTELAPFCCLFVGVQFDIIGWMACDTCPCQELPEFNGFKEFEVGLAVCAKKPVQTMQLVHWKTMIQHSDLNWVSNADI